jgi:nucleotide-binding universal stress UspA family protein
VPSILACVDFSDATDAVAREAARRAGPGGVLHLLHVAAGEPALAGYDHEDLPWGAEEPHTRSERAAELTDEHRRLRGMAERLEADAPAEGLSGLSVTPLLVMEDDDSIVEMIVREAERLDVDTIVVGSHGHGLLHRIALGSTSAALGHHSSRPVLLVPVGQR